MRNRYSPLERDSKELSILTGSRGGELAVNQTLHVIAVAHQDVPGHSVGRGHPGARGQFTRPDFGGFACLADLHKTSKGRVDEDVDRAPRACLSVVQGFSPPCRWFLGPHNVWRDTDVAIVNSS